MKRHLVIAPHPDDETLGCGGTLLRAHAEGDETYWLIVTGISEEQGFTSERVESRAVEIDRVSEAYGFTETIPLNYPTSTLDCIPMQKIVDSISQAVGRRDAHSDHAVVFDAAVSVSKWFRYGSVDRIFVYETQSETDFDLAPDSLGFRPNVFIDISETLELKIDIARIFQSEFAAHPFPRSFDAIRALASVRGAASGFISAEAFMLLRQRIGKENVK